MNDLQFNVTYNQVVTTLQHAPIGWESMEVKFERSERYYGIFNEYTANINFAEDGATLIREAFYRDLWLEFPTLEILRRNRYTNVYERVILFELDMSTFTDTLTGVQITGIKGGLSRWLKANETTQFQFGELTTDQIKFYRDATSRQVEYYDLNRVAEMLFDKVTNGNYLLGNYHIDTTFIDQYANEIVIITGRSIREQSIGDLRLSFEDFFKIINSITPIGMTITEVLGVETLAFVARDTLYDHTEVDTIELGEQFSLKPYTPYIVRNVIAGYNTNDLEDATGKNYEFAVEAKHVLPISNLSNTYDIKCPIRADVYGMYEIWDTTDGSEDEMFLICVEDDPSSVYLRPSIGRVYNANLTNILAYNARISPKRSVTAHKEWIESMANGLTGFSMSFVSGGLHLKYLSTEIVYLSGDVAVEGTGFVLAAGTIFKPFLFSIDGTINPDFLDNYKANPYGYITFTFNGVTYSGFVLSLSYKTYGNRYAQLELLCTHDTDLTTLIR